MAIIAEEVGLILKYSFLRRKTAAGLEKFVIASVKFISDEINFEKSQGKSGLLLNVKLKINVDKNMANDEIA